VKRTTSFRGANLWFRLAAFPSVVAASASLLGCDLEAPPARVPTTDSAEESVQARTRGKNRGENPARPLAAGEPPWGIGAAFPESTGDAAGPLQPQFEALRDALGGLRLECQKAKGDLPSEIRHRRLAAALSGVRHMVSLSWKSAQQQYDEAKVLDAAVAQFAQAKHVDHFDAPTVLSWVLVDAIAGQLANPAGCGAFSPTGTALGAIAWATNPERIYQAAFDAFSADWISAGKVVLPAAASASIASTIVAKVIPPTAKLEGCEIAEGAFELDTTGGNAGSATKEPSKDGAKAGDKPVVEPPATAGAAAATAGKGGAPVTKAAARAKVAKPPVVRLDVAAPAMPRAFFSVSRSLQGSDIADGAPGSGNGALNPGEVVTLQIAVKAAVPGTWLVSESVVAESVPACMVVPWREVEAPEGQGEVTVALPALFVSTRCGTAEPLKLKLVSSQSAQTQSITVTMNAKSVGSGGKIRDMLIDSDMPGYSEVTGMEGGIGPGMALELTPTFELSGATSALINGPRFIDGGLFRSVKKLENQAPLIPYRAGLVRAVDDVDVLTVDAGAFADYLKGRCRNPLTCDSRISWVGFDVQADANGVTYVIRRYTTLPLAALQVRREPETP
jgi:hypothetical protein